MKNEVDLNFQAYDLGDQPSDESEIVQESQINDSDDDLPPIVDDAEDPDDDADDIS